MSTYTDWSWNDYYATNASSWERVTRALPATAIKEAKLRLLKEKEKLAHYDEIDQEEEDGGNV